MFYTSDFYDLCITASGHYEYNKWKHEALVAVSQNGLYLKNGSGWWRSDIDIVRAAIIQNPLAIRYAPSFQNDKSMAMLAVSINGLARFWLSADLQKDPDIQQVSEQNLPKEYTGYVDVGSSTFFAAFIENNASLKCLKDIDLYNDVFYVKLENPACTRFVRDSHVVLFSGRHLLPYPIKDSFLDEHLVAILPSTAEHLFIDKEHKYVIKEALSGKGYLEQNVYQAMVTSYDFVIPFKHGKTCIEGGNCFLFTSEDTQKAVVGELSLYLSMLALEMQGYFAEIKVDETVEPSIEAYRMARNLSLYHNEKKVLDEQEYKTQKKNSRAETAIKSTHSYGGAFCNC